METTCSICLDDLWKASAPASNHGGATGTNTSLGVAVPCGHVFHWDCFQSWKQSCERREPNRRKCNVKCPNCNKVTKDIIKPFLGLPTVYEGSDDDNDDDSLSSCSEKENDEPEAQTGAESSSTVAAPLPQSPVPLAATSTNQVEQIIDLTEDSPSSPVRQHLCRTVSTTSSSDGKKAKKYRRHAKRLRMQTKQQQAELKRLVQTNSELQRKVNEEEERNRTVAFDFERLEEERDQLGLDNAEFKLQSVTLRRDLVEARQQVQRERQGRADAIRKCRELEKNFNKEINNATAKSMDEVKQLQENLDFHCTENQELKDRVRELETKLENIKYSRMHVPQHSGSLASAPPPKNRASLKETLQTMREFDRNVSRMGAGPRSSKSRNASISKAEAASAAQARLKETGKYSGRALLAIQNATKNKSSRTSLSKRSTPSSAPMPQAKRPSTGIIMQNPYR